jgi:hypothetical protein
VTPSKTQPQYLKTGWEKGPLLLCRAGIVSIFESI